MRSPCLHVVILTGLATAVPAQEVAVPEFDTKKAKASYVLAVPPKHDPKKPAPLILDFHGAIQPSRKGANVSYDRMWSKFVQKEPVLVLGLNSRTRAWNMTKGDRNDIAYALHVLAKIRKENRLSADEIYLAGFSSGSDFLCTGGIQLHGKFAGSLVVCPGPASVLGVRNGEILRAKEHPFYFVTGEEDYIRKDGAWQAFLTLEKAGGRVMYREVPGLGHSFPSTEESQRNYHYLCLLAGRAGKVDERKIATEAFNRGDYLLASTHAGKLGAKGEELLAKIAERGAGLMKEAEEVSWKDEPGRAFETWWHLMTQFHRFPKVGQRAQRELKADHDIPNRDMMRARRDYFGPGGRRPIPGKPTSQRPTPEAPQVGVKRSPAATGPWSFDNYLSYDEVTERLKLLARENPQRVRLTSMGKSVLGRELWVCEISDDLARLKHKPAIYVQGGIHGNEISSVMVTLYFAWQMGANPDRRRAIDRLLRDTTFYVAPTVNPDAIQHFVTQPNSYWRPRFNFRPHDADEDGKVDEDGYEDINLFFDYHNAANCVFYWSGPDGQVEDPADVRHMTAIAGRAHEELGFAPRLLNHDGAGLSIAWAYGERGIPACIVELKAGDEKAWKGDVFVKATKCKHPQLGEVWIGNDYKKLPRRNPPPVDIYAQVAANWEFMRNELKELPKLKLEQPRIVREGEDFRVTGFIANTGKMPMRVRLKHRTGVSAFKTGEFYRAQMAPIGVACHEMGHTFGVNDKYGLGAPDQPLGRWCLMGKGTHGSGESMQHRPFHMCAWCKMVIGWVEPAIIDPAVTQKVALRPILSSPHECLRVLLKPDGSEYLLLSNRRKEGFMTELPSPGLVVLKVGPNTRPAAPQKQVQLLEAHGLGPAQRSELQKLDQIAWPQEGKSELTVFPTDGDGVRLSHIRRKDDVVYFEIGPAGN